MSTKGFLLLLATVIAIGGSIGGAFAGGLALGRGQDDDAGLETTLLQQRFGGGGQTSFGGLAGGQFLGESSGGPGSGLTGGSGSGEHTQSGDGQGFSRQGEDHTVQGGFGGGAVSREVFNGTVTALDGNVLTIAAGEEQNQLDLGENTTVQIFSLGTADDISQGDRVLVIVSGDTSSGGPVDAIAVTVNAPESGGAFGGGGGFGGRGGFGGGETIGVLNGTVGSVDGSQITVVTEAGETQVNLGGQVAIQLYEAGTTDDISPGVRVLVITTTDDESGEPVTTTSVVINPPEGGFGGGGFGGRPRRP